MMGVIFASVTDFLTLNNARLINVTAVWLCSVL